MDHLQGADYVSIPFWVNHSEQLSICMVTRSKNTSFYFVYQDKRKIVPLRFPSFIEPIFRNATMQPLQCGRTGTCHIRCEMSNKIVVVLAFTPGTRENAISLHILGCQFKARNFNDPKYTTEIFCVFNHVRNCNCETKLLRAISNAPNTSDSYPANLFLFVQNAEEHANK